MLANLVGHDVSSTTGGNLYRLGQETGLNPWTASPLMVRMALQQSDTMVPEEDGWRLPLLEKLLLQRYNLELQVQDTSEVQTLIVSLCSS